MEIQKFPAKYLEILEEPLVLIFLFGGVIVANFLLKCHCRFTIILSPIYRNFCVNDPHYNDIVRSSPDKCFLRRAPLGVEGSFLRNLHRFFLAITRKM